MFFQDKKKKHAASAQHTESVPKNPPRTFDALFKSYYNPLCNRDSWVDAELMFAYYPAQTLALFPNQRTNVDYNGIKETTQDKQKEVIAPWEWAAMAAAAKDYIFDQAKAKGHVPSESEFKEQLSKIQESTIHNAASKIYKDEVNKYSPRAGK